MANELARLNVRLQLQNQQLLSGLERSQRKLATFTQKSNKTLNSFRRTAVSSFKAVGVAAGGLSLAAIGSGVVRVAADFESLRISLQTVTGSAEAAKQAFTDIQEFTASTPFQLQEVTNAFIKLQARGLDPGTDALRAYGNVAAGMSKTLDQFVEAVGDAATGEFERLKEFGIIARSQGEDVQFTFRGITTTVRKEAAAIEGYLKQIGEVDFAGATADQMDTFTGKVSNLKDALATLADQFATNSGLMTGLKRFTGFLTDSINALTEGREFLTPFGQAIEEVTDRLDFLRNEQEKGRFTLFPGGNEAVEDQIILMSNLLDRLKDQRDEFLEVQSATPGSDTFVGPLPAAAPTQTPAATGLSESEKEFQKWRSTLIDVGKETETLQRKVEFLDTALLEGSINAEEHRIELERLTGAQGEHIGSLDKALVKTSDKVAEVGRGALDMGFAFSSAFEDAVLGGEKVSEMLEGLARDVSQVALRQLITAPLGTAVSGGISKTFPGFATGGAFTVGGTGGTDSQTVAFRATPGERVTISPPGAGGGGSIVNIYNTPGSEAKVSRSNSSSGQEIINVVISEISKDIAGGGSTAQTLEGLYGLRRQGVMRT